MRKQLLGSWSRAVVKRLMSLAGLPGALPIAVAIFTFAIVWVGQEPPGVFADFDYLWVAARAVWHGLDPYAAVREGIEQGRFPTPFYYPAPAAVLMAPLGMFSRHLSIALFTTLGMSLLTLSVDGWRRWIVVSAPAIQALLFGQWSPWLTAAIGLPWLGALWAAKPSVGLALFAGWPSRWALWGGLAILMVSLLLLPHWPIDWLQTLRHAPQYRAPVQRAGGALLLLAFLRWRQPQARMLGVLALIPHTTGLYEQLPLLLVPQTKLAFATLMGLSYLAAVLVYALVPYGPSNIAGTLDAQWPYFLVLVYLPALLMVLWTRERKQDGPPPGGFGCDFTSPGD